MGRKALHVNLMRSLVRLSQRAAAVPVLGRARQSSPRATTANTKLRHALNQGQKVEGRESQRVLLLGSICLEEIMTSRRKYEIGMIVLRGAQASWDAFLMIAFAMRGAQAAWSAPHETETVVVTVITETAVRTFHHDTEHARPITGITHRAALIIPLMGGLSTMTSETELRSVMINHHLNVVEQLIAMKQVRRAGVLSLKATT